MNGHILSRVAGVWQTSIYIYNFREAQSNVEDLPLVAFKATFIFISFRLYGPVVWPMTS